MACRNDGALETCWGQKHTVATFDGIAGLNLDVVRLPMQETQTCQDCNDEAHKDGLCTFTTGYFIDNESNHKDHDLACPFQTKTRTETYYRHTKDPNATGTTMADSWTSKVWWLPDTNYEYPYCKTDITYFDQFVLNSHELTYDQGYQCTLYEWRGPNYGVCEANWPGFISPTKQNTPTETPVDQTYFTQINQDGESTQITLMECPVNTDFLGIGGVGPEHTCMMRQLGTCYNSETSDYCHSGADYSCPLGFKRAGTNKNTMGDCVACVDGEFCGKKDQMTATTPCTDGFMCLGQTEDANSFPAQPGTIIASNTAPQTESGCTSNSFCPGGQNAVNTCPAGYANTLASDGLENFSAAACMPHDAGTVESTPGNSGACPAGEYCPQGSSTALKCPTGTYRSSNGAESIDDCTACPAGSFCDEGSTSSTGNCAAGQYCPK